MKKITSIEVPSDIRNPFDYTFGYNTAVDEAEKEIKEMEYNFNKDITELSKNYELACKDVEKWMMECDELKQQLATREKQAIDQTKIIEILQDQIAEKNREIVELRQSGSDKVEQVDEKNCDTCLYKNLDGHSAPCKDCGVLDYWQPQVKVEPETLTKDEMVRNLTNRIEKLETESHDETSRYFALLQKVEKLYLTDESGIKQKAKVLKHKTIEGAYGVLEDYTGRVEIYGCILPQLFGIDSSKDELAMQVANTPAFNQLSDYDYVAVTITEDSK